MKDKTDDKDWELMAKFITEEADQESADSFHRQLEENNMLREDFDTVRDHWSLINETIVKEKLDIDQAWKSQKERVLRFEESKVNRPLLGRIWFKVAALLVIGLSVTLTYFSINQVDAIAISTGVSEERRVELPDGSAVFLNGNSTISISNDFKKEKRLVELHGEAFFEVVGDPLKPFIVSTRNGIITVLGTSFNVSSYDVEKTIVFVSSGRVLYNSHSNPSVIDKLSQNDLLIHEKDMIAVKENKDLNIISWKTNHVTFQETGLDEVFDLLSAAYKKQIVWNEADISNCYLSAEYNDLPMEDVMTSICTVFGLSYTQEKETYKIFGRGCQ